MVAWVCRLRESIHRGFFREESRHSYLEENLLHAISNLWYVWFQVVTESSSYTLIKADDTIPQVVGYKGLKTKENYKTVSPTLVVVVYERCSFMRILITKLCLGKLWCFGSVVAYGSWSYGGSNVWWNQNKPLLQRNPDITNNILLIMVEYVKQDPDIRHFTASLETGPVFSRIALWDCLGDQDRPRFLRNLLMAHFGKEW